jgi:hypothetical protein
MFANPNKLCGNMCFSLTPIDKERQIWLFTLHKATTANMLSKEWLTLDERRDRAPEVGWSGGTNGTGRQSSNGKSQRQVQAGR